MDNAQKAIMLGVGLFITIIVIAAVMAITGIGQDLISSGQSQISGLSGQLASQIQSAYDNVKHTGSQVRTAIQKYYNEESLSVYLVTELVTSTNPASNFNQTNISKVSAYNAEGIGTYAAPYVCTPNYIDMTGVSSAKVTISPTDIKGNAMNISGLTINNGYLKSGNNRPSLADITGKIQSNGRYKSALIINEATSEIMGILFARYQ